nr:hypothetical protein [Tanacetum cinerariifolium]
MDQQYPTVAKIPVLDTRKFEQWQFWIQQYLQHEHYALWEVIEFRDSYVVPASSSSTMTTDTTSGETGTKSGRTVTLTAKDMQKKNDVKARTTLLLSLPDEHQLRFTIFFLFAAAYFTLDSFLPFLDGVNELIIKNKIPRDLHPRLPLEEFVMSELLDDAIIVYHRSFDFSCVRIPFSLFLLALIKHYKAQFSQLRPLCHNKVITFEIICRSLQIEPTVTLFRVFQTFTSKRHPDSAINNPKPSVDSFNMDDAPIERALMGIHNFLCLVEWTGAEVQEEPYHDIRPTLQRLPFYYTPLAVFDDVIPDLTLKDLTASNPSAKVVAKAEASQKR